MMVLQQRSSCRTHSGVQVIANTQNWMAHVPGQQVFRAHFSSIAAPDIKKAMVSSHATLCQLLTTIPCCTLLGPNSEVNATWPSTASETHHICGEGAETPHHLCRQILGNPMRMRP